MSFSRMPIPATRHEFDRLPLSYAQQRQWFMWQFNPASAANNISMALRFKGQLDSDALQRSFRALIERHEALRTYFVQDGEQAAQVLHPEGRFELERGQLAKGDAPMDTRLADFVQAQTQRAFDLENGPLLRAALLQVAEQDHVLTVVMHHIVSDGWSLPIMVGELVQLYEGLRRGTPAQLPHLPIQYADYAIWQRQLMEAGEQDRQLAYWKTQLGYQQPVLELPTDRPRPAMQGHEGASLEIQLDDDLARALKQVAKAQGVTLFMLLLASFQSLLHRYCGQDDIRVGVPIANRNRVETQGLVGFFVNTLVLKAEFDLTTTFSDLLQQVQATTLAAQAHQDLPFEQLVEALHPERSLSHSPLFQVMYNHQTHIKGERHTLPGLTVENLAWERRTAHFDLTLDTFEQAQGIGASISYATALFDESTIAQMARHWRNLLQGIIEQPGQRVAELPLLDQAERQFLLTQWDQTHGDYPDVRFVHQLFADQAARTPEARAVVFGEQQLTYGQLDSQANRLAQRLVQMGVGPEVRVVIAMRRSAEIMVAFLAVLKAGGVYVPLDIAYPPERLRYMMKDCSPALVLTQEDLLSSLPLPEGLPTVAIGAHNEWDRYPDTAPHVPLATGNLAYVIYTSGSTGMPKGVAVPHGPLVSHILATGERYEMGAADCELHFMSFAFDGAHEGWMHPLINGASVLVRDDSLWLPEQTYEQMHRHGVTVGVFPPVYLQQLAEHAERVGNPPAVRIYCFGGDAVPQASYELAWRALRPTYLFNGYGPTETVVTPLLWKAPAGEPCGAAYAPIGTLLGRRRGYVLNASLNLVPVGQAGELYLGGDGVARGYLDRPGLTAERFVPDPFGQAGERVYRSGDLTRARPDGVVDYLGRIDYQVKVRGFRIELGEIEARLQEHPAIRETVVIDIPGASGKQLAAYLVADEQQSSTPEQQSILRGQLREHLGVALPDYMVPTYLLFLQKMPLTPNGKLDRKALPAPDVSAQQHEYVAPQSELERQIAAIWADVLKVEKVGLTDNFFELGGDSIISIQVVSRARQVGIRFTPKELFQHQTVQGLASVAKQGDTDSLKIDQGPVTGEALLLPIHQHFFASDIPQRHHWNQALLLKPGQALNGDTLAQALQALIVHHDALRLSFVESAGTWTAHYRAVDQQPVLWQREVKDAHALEALCNEAQASLNLQDGPLLRAVLATLADGSQRLLLALHHLVVDGVSWRILLEDLQAAYQQLDAGQALQLPAKTSSTQAWAEHLQTYARSETLQAQRAYWHAQLEGVSADLPCDNPEGSLQGIHAGNAQTRLDATLTRQLLQQAPAAYRTQVNDLLLTALARVIARWTQRDDVLVQLEGHGREELFDTVDLTRTVGWFTSLFPVKLSAASSLDTSIKQIKEQLRAVPDKGIGFGALRYLGDAPGLAQLPVPRITFNYLGQFDGSFAEGDSAFLTPAMELAGASQSETAPLANWLAINGKVYGGELSLNWTFSRAMFNDATIEALAADYAEELQALVAHCIEPGHAGLTPSDVPLAQLSQAQLDSLAIPASQIEDLYPLSPMQQGMLFHALYEQGSGHYINQMRVDVKGLDVDRFQAAWQAAVDRHEVLRANFVNGFEQPLQVIRKQVKLPFTRLEWQGTPNIEQALDTWAEADLHTGFDLQQDTLLRLAVIRTAEDGYHLIYTSHHILMDGWSNAQLLAEVLQEYAGLSGTPQPGRYSDYIDWLQRQDPAQSQAFWQQQLQPLEAPTRLALSIRQPVNTPDAGYGDYRQVLDQQQTLALTAFARQHHVTVNTLVQATWLLLLQRYTGQACVTFGATVSGRPADLKGVEQQLGLFINTLPVIASPRAEQRVSEWIEQVQAQNLALREYEHSPLYDIQRWANGGGESLFDTLLVFENYPVSEALQQGAPAGLVFSGTQNREQTNYPLTLAIGLGTQLSVHYSYDRRFFDSQAVEQVAGHFGQLLLGLVEDAQQALGEMQLLKGDEQQQILVDWNRTAQPYPAEQCVHQLVEAQAARTPDAVALVHGEQELTYQQLNGRANQLARHLRKLGIGPDVLVGVALARGLDLVVSLLAILKAGGAYVPLDPAYPQERLAYMLQDSQARVLLSHASLLEHLPQDTPAHLVLLDTLELQDSASDNLTPLSAPQNLAVSIYTSGSTGLPKGVLIEHRNIAALIGWAHTVYSQDDLKGVLACTSICFDLSVWELFVTLSAGGYAVIAQNALALPLLAAKDRVHLINTVPSAIKALHDAGQIPASVRIINLAGEPLKQALVDNLYGLGHVQHVHDLYGPSEDTTYSTCTRREAGGQANIGRPIANSAGYVLDGTGNPLPVGGAGEFCLAGAGLARGYLGRAALTAEKFLPNPFDTSAQGGGRLYRTGDLTRYRADGVIEYVGRIDHQVKIRGFRIELGEIELTLLAHPSVREAVVVDIEGPGGRQLVAYLVADGDVQGLREHLKTTLPDYMVPAHLVSLDALPLTPNGKLDRKALPKPDTSQLQQVYVAPQSELEQQIAAIWADVLKVEKVGLTDNFFELGGDSIISIQVVSRARQVGIRFTPKELFQHQTVQGLASVAKQGDTDSLKIDQGPVTGEALLLPIHQHFFASDIPQRHHWNQALLLKPGQALNGDTLAQALQALIVHHDALRLSFVESAGTWTAHYRAVDQQPVLWQREVKDAHALEALCNEAQASLNLQDGPLLRAVLATLADGSQRLLLALHHLVVDGVSWRILLEDLQAAYQRLDAGQALQLPAKTSSTQAWAEHLQTYARSETLQAQRAYWHAQLEGASADLPCDNPEGSLQGIHAGNAQTRLDATLTRQLLQQAPAAYRTQVNDLLLTALARVIARWTQRDDVLVQLEGHGREELFDTVDLTRTVGWFTSLFPVKLSAASSLDTSIKQIKEQLRAVPDKGIGFGALRYLGDEPGLAQLPVPRITFNYLGQFDGSFAEGDSAFLTPAMELAGASQSETAPLANWLAINGKVYGGELSLNWTFSRAMFNDATIEALAADYAEELQALVAHCIEPGHAGLTPSDVPLAQLSQAQLDSLAIPASQIEDLYPLSPMQQGMLFHALYEQGSGHYINQMRVDVKGLDVDRFQAAWQAAVDRHEVLRANFVNGFEQPLQVIRKQVKLPFTRLEWQGTPNIEQALDTWVEAERAQGFNLERDPLIRITVIRTATDTHHVVYTSHHILMDGWSNSRLLGGVLQTYAGVADTVTTGNYRDYIEWLHRQDPLHSEMFWKGRLQSLDEPTRLAQAMQRTGASRGAGHGDHHQVLDQQQAQALTSFARQHRVTVNTLVQAAWLLLLQRYTGHACVAAGATVSGRPADLKGVEQQLGLFINTLPVIAEPRGEQRISEWIEQVQAQNLALREHEHTPLYDIQRWAGGGGEGLFDTLLVFENYPVSEALQQGAPAGLAFTDVRNHEQTNYPLTVVVGHGETLSVHYSYDRAHFSDASVEQLAGHFASLLSGMVRQPEQRLGELPLLRPDEQQQVIVDWNDTQAEFPTDQCVQALIEAQVARTPEATALLFGDHALTYRQLNQRANQLAHQLRELGVGPDVLVGIAADRSLEMVVGLLGIIKAGGAYVPLDPEYPTDRLAYMMADSGISLLVTQEHLLAQLPIPTGVKHLILAPGADYSDANPVHHTQPANLAYVIYTSGSTGKPKGAGNSHRALVNRLCWMQKVYGLDGRDTVLQKTPFSFDVSVWEFFWPLLSGARLAVAQPGDHRDPERLVQVIRQHSVTTLHFVPSMLQAFMTSEQVHTCTSLTRVVCSGEALPADLAQQTLARLPGAGLYNLYGPTEAAIDVTHWTCPQGLQSSVPIGQPIDNLKTYILGADLHAVAPRTGGELYVGGVGLARGYHQRPALTAERFVPDPFDTGARGGGRLYRTGDLARYRADGMIDYLGRLDHQVKIRGLRIELGEIEARLLEHKAVREAVVVDIDGPAGKQLAAYLVAEDSAPLRDELRQHLKESLPDYMVPTHLLCLDGLPVTANGKLDRKALPAPDASHAQQIYVAPGTELEKQLANIWADLLNIDQVGLHDHFFELGGHSLLATQLMVRLRELAGIDMALRDLFERPRLLDLALHLEQKAKQIDPFEAELAKSLEALKRLTTEEIDELIS
ncbi:non-ribosomal peptide synthase/polyketide synthase [Pseudomonas eucalypticola]|uniref:Non-ribosomal peptide synthase/polyketide synthase n=2 Tax=Pseudomonas eucalypticola TaxID=2599595 RepID=A0A7D5DE02_9PSED|nr:non-ribosomal peptide synthase/polyketide synthase [Pseudomonas eucalypticola]